MFPGMERFCAVTPHHASCAPVARQPQEFGPLVAQERDRLRRAGAVRADPPLSGSAVHGVFQEIVCSMDVLIAPREADPSVFHFPPEPLDFLIESLVALAARLGRLGEALPDLG